MKGRSYRQRRLSLWLCGLAFAEMRERDKPPIERSYLAALAVTLRRDAFLGLSNDESADLSARATTEFSG